MPARLKRDEPSVVIRVRVPESYANWLEMEGGGRRGATSTAVRRLIKEEAWRREGKSVLTSPVAAIVARILTRMMKSSGISRSEAAISYNAIVTTIAALCQSQSRVHIDGLGVFWAQKVGAHEGHDFQSGGRVTVPAYVAVRFKPSVELKRKLPLR